MVAGNYVVINHTYLPTAIESEARLISSVGNTNQLVLTTAPTYAVAPGDVIYNETAGAAITIASSTTTPTTFTGPGILSGQPGLPMLLTLTATAISTNTIDAVNCSFLK